jgi:hypothetical protein
MVQRKNKIQLMVTVAINLLCLFNPFPPTFLSSFPLPSLCPSSLLFFPIPVLLPRHRRVFSPCFSVAHLADCPIHKAIFRPLSILILAYRYYMRISRI